jgi:hypothetical protein
MAQVELDENGIEIPSEIIECGEYTIIRYADGREYKLRGYGCMKDTPLDLDPRIDLTKPIYEQAMKLWAQDAEEERRQAGSKAA